MGFGFSNFGIMPIPVWRNEKEEKEHAAYKKGITDDISKTASQMMDPSSYSTPLWDKITGGRTSRATPHAKNGVVGHRVK
tara:strand:- start:3951 stop:4190 length:240 start_codon:yes stop_codon:yes gene_type:complete